MESSGSVTDSEEEMVTTKTIRHFVNSSRQPQAVHYIPVKRQASAMQYNQMKGQVQVVGCYINDKGFGPILLSQRYFQILYVYLQIQQNL